MMKHNHLILHVDDDPDDLDMLQLAFKNLDQPCTLLQQTSGLQCLKTLQQWEAEKELPCLIVLDFNMPQMNGKDTFTAIRNNPKLCGIPIIIFSSSSNEKDRNLFQGDNVEYMVKPFTVDSLMEAAAHMLTICGTHKKVA